MRPPASCRCKSAAGDRIGASARGVTGRSKKRNDQKRDTVRPFVIFVIGERKSGCEARRARLLDLYGVSDPPRAHAVSQAVLSTREFGAKQIIRGKDASRFGYGEREKERGKGRERIDSFYYFFISNIRIYSCLSACVCCFHLGILKHQKGSNILSIKISAPLT